MPTCTNAHDAAHPAPLRVHDQHARPLRAHDVINAHAAADPTYHLQPSCSSAPTPESTNNTNCQTSSYACANTHTYHTHAMPATDSTWSADTGRHPAGIAYCYHGANLVLLFLQSLSSPRTSGVGGSRTSDGPGAAGEAGRCRPWRLLRPQR